MAESPPEPAPPPCRDSRACAAAIGKHREAIAYAMLDNLYLMPRWAQDIRQNQRNLDSFVARELHVFVDYIRHYLRSGDDAYMHLYVGEKLKQTYDTGLEPGEAAELRRQLALLDTAAFSEALGNSLHRDRLKYLRHTLAIIHSILESTGEKPINVLFVQDCLYLDVLAFLTAPLVQDGIGIRPFYATSKNPQELRAKIRELSKNKIEAVFFSPFTYEFSPEFAQLLNWRNSLMPSPAVLHVVESAMADSQKTLDLLADLFDCHVFIHNTSMLIREPSALKRRMKNLATRRTRRAAGNLVNHRLSSYIAGKNQATFEHLFIIDETKPLRRQGEHALGALLYSSALQHPAAFGREIAADYGDLLFVEVNLLKKKLVVCDLDNTLWEGLIGEGEVRPYIERQKTLKELRRKGIVLAVNSKNDPANVHWDGCVLSDDDFVCREISWEPKVTGLRRIQSALNLKLRDYIFIDDRADEREMIRAAFPEILTLDATDPRSWRLLGRWASLLETHPEMDRTLLYRQREERQQFLQAEEGSVCDPGEMFKNLELKVHIHPARQTDVRRVTELINRTNQFNLCGSRTSFGDVNGWYNAPNSLLLTVHTSDRFGPMGMVCAALVKAGADALEIPVFVLSCRVFGYGIENAVMNYIKRLAKGREIVGHYRETGQNAPCRNFYLENGFLRAGDIWKFSGKAGLDPAWLETTAE